jgi:hypothetical protein
MFTVTASDGTTGEFWAEAFPTFTYALKEAERAREMKYTVSVKRGDSDGQFPWNYDPQQDHTCVIQETPDGMGCVQCLYT